MLSYYRFSAKQFLLWFMAFTVLGFILAQTEIADEIKSGGRFYAWEPWSWAFTAVYAYALVTPAIIYFCNKWPLGKTQIVKTFLKLVLLYIPITLIFITLMFAFRYLVYWLVPGVDFNPGDPVDIYVYEFPKTISFYFMVAFVAYTRFYRKQAHQEQLNAAKLHGELLDARLEVLQHQLRPHFLFNTLNLISSTMYQDVDKADSIIARLADLLRYSLATQHEPFVSLQQELDAMKSYLEIAQLRFGERLTTELQIEAAAQSVMIPVMLLQPLLENAVKYGIEPSDNGGSILISAKLVDNHLVIRIVNSIHQPSIKRSSFGIGLENTQKRLEYLYQEKASLVLSNPDEDRIELTIRLPVERLHHAAQD